MLVLAGSVGRLSAVYAAATSIRAANQPGIRPACASGKRSVGLFVIKLHVYFMCLDETLRTDNARGMDTAGAHRTKPVARLGNLCFQIEQALDECVCE